MPEEQLTVSGTVTDIVPWKSDKGVWVNFEDNPNDFYAFKARAPNVGEKGTWNIKEGKGFLEGKCELVKLLNKPTTADLINKKAKEEVKDMENEIAKGDKVYFDKQELIVKQCCIKAAAQAIIVNYDQNKPQDIKTIAERVVDMADRFFCYICRGEGPEEPQPEDE